MFARVAWRKVKPGTWQEYEQVYHDAILPDTRNVKGLVFRELLQGADDPNEDISLTLWERREDLNAYEQSDLYQRLVLTQIHGTPGLKGTMTLIAVS